jgi:hypothetical protein
MINPSPSRFDFNRERGDIQALVRKPSHFFIKSLAIDFGPCMLGEVAPVTHSITVTNTSKQARVLAIRYEPKDFVGSAVVGDIELDMAVGGSLGPLSKEAEEQIEQLEQKLKIATRKGRPDKVEKIKQKLAELRGQVATKAPPSFIAAAASTDVRY